MVRASLVPSDLLMRALGRPNREQIVSMRPDNITTLEAIDLANGEQLAGLAQARREKLAAWPKKESRRAWSTILSCAPWGVQARPPEKSALVSADPRQPTHRPGGGGFALDGPPAPRIPIRPLNPPP
jgi:hypothetical protein